MRRLDCPRPHWLLLSVWLLIATVRPVYGAYHVNNVASSMPQLPDTEVTLAWEGYVRPPGWTEIYVTLTNEADISSVGDWQGELLITDNFNQITYRQALNLPAHSRKHYRIPVFIDEVYPLDITLKSEGQEAMRKLGEVSSLSLRRPGTGLVCAIADAQIPSRLERFISTNTTECGSRVHLGHDLSKLPETPMAWDTLDVLILNGVDTTTLTDAQRRAMLAWVSAGGHLIVGGGPALAQTVAGLPGELHIAHLQPTTKLTRTLSLNADRPGAWGRLDNQIIAALQPKIGTREVITSGDAIAASTLKLAVHRGVGKGQVDFIGWDLSLADDALPWVRTRWAEDTAPAIRLFKTEEQTLSAIAVPNRSQRLLEVPTTAVPKLGSLFLLFPLYLFLMGPGTMFIVRRLRRPILTWVLLPLWIILGITLMAFQLTGIFSHSFPIIHDIAVVYAPGGPNLPARVVQSTAIFAPQGNARYRSLRWESTGVPRPLWGHYTTDSWYGSGDPFKAHVLRTGTDKTQVRVDHPIGILTWANEGLTNSPAITSTLSLASVDKHFILQGKISSSLELRQVSLHLDGGKYQYPLLENLAASHPITLSQVLTDPLFAQQGQSLHPYARGRSNDQSYLCAQVGNLQESPSPISKPGTTSPQDTSEGHCYLSGVVDSVPFPPEAIGGTHIAETCLIYAIPCPRQHTGTVKITHENLRIESQNGWIDELGIHISRPATTVTYQLPTFLDIRELTKLTLRLQMDHTAPASAEDIQAPGELALWNWDEKQWEPFPLTEQDPEITLESPHVQQFVTPQSGLRVRLTPLDRPTLSRDRNVPLEITLEGKW